MREIWLYLLRKANHSDVNVHGTVIKRGQLVTRYSDILDDLSWYVGFRKESYKRHHCETAMKLLTREQMITTTRTTRGMIVTICNYDYYQTPENYETDKGRRNKATTKPQSSHTINKNVKNIKNKKKDIYTPAQKEEFEKFNKWVDEKIPYIRGVRNQLTIDQYFEILKTYNKKQLMEILTNMANWKPITKNNVSVYQTFLKWAKKEYGQATTA